VERYDPEKGGLNDSLPLFRNWLNTCWRRDLAAVLSVRAANKRITNKNPISLDGVNHAGKNIPGDALLLQGIDDLRGSSAYSRKTKQEGDRVFNAAWLKEFRAFVRKHRPDLLPVLAAMGNGDSIGSRQHWHYLTHKIRGIAKHFERGTVPQNSAYRKRKNEAQKRYYHSHLEEQREWHRQHAAKKQGKAGPKFR
jgi:hypothetical protein